MCLLKQPLLFFLFFLSGFCSLVYQVVWTRLAFASFGIITPVLSVVLSVFMLGLALGSWAGGRWVRNLTERSRLSAVSLYAAAEFFVGLGAFCVPKLFSLGESLLLGAGESNSFNYLLSSAIVLALSILPWCVFMGATMPLMMAYIRERAPSTAESFSYLYLANVLGAMSGTLLSAVALVEIFGFHDTLTVAASGNFLIAAIAVWLGRHRVGAFDHNASEIKPVDCLPDPKFGVLLRDGNRPMAEVIPPRLIRLVLFSTGFIAMALEVVWTRAFAPVVKTQVYSFAAVVATYLGATFAGSWLYRRHLGLGNVRSTGQLLALLGGASLLPVLVNDARWLHVDYSGSIHLASVLVLLAGICPFCGILGYLTPGLVDVYARGAPKTAGSAYALNVLGCVLGPLFASYIILPFMSERFGGILLSLPILGFGFACRNELSRGQKQLIGVTAAAMLALALFFTQSFEDYILRHVPGAVVRRDHAASVLSFSQNGQKRLLVNGIGMTSLSPITKFMVHLPLAFHRSRPHSALVICFGMGTSYRSALSWGVQTTSVELIPSVKAAFGFYHADAAQCLARGRVVIDDGRRFLKRSRELYDVIVIDPPPPPEAAGSSLLYSTEFYDLAKQHLKPGGIVEQWIPWDIAMGQAALRSLCDSFPYVRCFDSIEHWGVHLVASAEPIEACTAAQLAARMPPAAQSDLLEWSRGSDLVPYIGKVLAQESPTTNNLNPNPLVRITDDQPYNEYFLLRRWGMF